MTSQSKNTYKIGDKIIVLSLKRKGIVLATSGNNFIKVSIGDLQMNCKATDLIPAISPDKKDLHKRKTNSFQKSNSKAPTSLDLHGFTAAAAKEALLTFISRAVMAGHQQVTVIHGHGAGKVKAVVHSTLSELDMVASFRHPINSTAETKVYFK